MVWEIVQLVCIMVGIIGLIILLMWALRKFNKGMIASGGKRLKVLDRAMLGNDKSVVVVSVAGKCMVLGVTAGRIDKICDLEVSEEDYLKELYPENNQSGNGGFFSAFTDALKKNAGGMVQGNNKNRADINEGNARQEDEKADD